MNNTVQISTTGSHDDITLINIRGFFDTVVAYSLQEQVHTLLGSGRLKYIVNLEELEHISSAGIGFFSGFVLELRKYRGKLIFINIPEQVQYLFKITRLMDLFTVGKSMQEALALLETAEAENNKPVSV